MMALAKLIARDGTLCGLCNTRLDLALTYPHPLSATRGHIAPVTRGGGHEPSNMRLEHLNCNVRKFDHLDSELSLPFTPPKPPDDVVALMYATARHRKGSLNQPREARVCAGLRTFELYGSPTTDEGNRQGGRVTNHQRWHVRRNVFSPICPLCTGAESISSITRKIRHLRQRGQTFKHIARVLGIGISPVRRIWVAGGGKIKKYKKKR